MAWQGIRGGTAPRDLLRAVVLFVPLLLLALSGDWWSPSPLEPVLKNIWLPVGFAICMVVGFGWPVLRRAVVLLRRGRLGGDLLIVLGALAGIALSLWQARLGPVDAAAQILIWRDAAFAASLIAVAGLGDLVARADRVPARSVAKGGSETISVAPGELIPVDGTVRDGRSEIQDPHGSDDIFPSVVTCGDRVHAGARNGDSVLLIVPSPSALPPRLKVRDGGVGAEVTAWAVPVMLLLAVLIFVWRSLMGPVMADPVLAALRLAMLSAPLGLGLVVAAPAAELLRATREMGLEIHNLAVLARLPRLRAVIFGHRGVLIPERHRVISVQTPDGDHGSAFIARAASVAQAGHDPWGRSLLDLAVSYRMRLKNAQNYQAVIGEGVMADVGDRPTLFGSREFLENHGIDCSQMDEAASAALAQGRRLRWVGEGGGDPQPAGLHRLWGAFGGWCCGCREEPGAVGSCHGLAGR
jgi:Cu+-exporting ATPase